jgi:hypothetical protein
VAQRTFRGFADFATGWQREVVNGVDAAIRKITQLALQGIVEEVIRDTPVDTGKARANWLASLGSPRGSVRETLGKSPEAAIGEAKAVISFYRNGSVFYLVNNTDYIDALNKGKSSQQSAGFIERAFARGVERGIAASTSHFKI